LTFALIGIEDYGDFFSFRATAETIEPAFRTASVSCSRVMPHFLVQ